MGIKVGSRSAKFLVAHPTDLTFLAKAGKFSEEGVPSFFGFAFSSMEQFKSYGVTSEKFEVALRAADFVMDYVVKAMADHKVAVQHLFLDRTPVVQKGEELIRSVSEILDSVSVAAFGRDIFALGESRASVCESLN